MTADTFRAALSLMDIEVTALTLSWEPLVAVLDVTFAAALLLMEPLKGVATLSLVVEVDLLPPLRDMTFFAGLGELPLMEVLVAVRAARIDRLKVPLLVTVVTGEVAVSPLERKATPSMVEELDRPAL